MDWANKQLWKDCVIATALCLLGCSIGVMGITTNLTSINWFFVFLLSFASGYASCVLFMVIWNMVFQKFRFSQALAHSYKMSFVSMAIMVITENLITFLLLSGHNAHKMEAHSERIALAMVISMLCGFILALPYNYYQLHENGKVCH